MTDISKWVMKKMSLREDCSEADTGEINLFSASTSSNDGAFRGSSRASVDMKEAVVQGTLISHLHAKMQPRMARVFVYAKVLYHLGVLLVLWGIYDEGANILSILLEYNLLGAFMTIGLECIIHKLMIQICFVDLIFVGLVKLRLFNGYMSDDVVLTSFCLLQGYADDLNRQFNIGAQQMARRITQEELSWLAADAVDGSAAGEQASASLPMRLRRVMRDRTFSQLRAGGAMSTSTGARPVVPSSTSEKTAEPEKKPRVRTKSMPQMQLKEELEAMHRNLLTGSQSLPLSQSGMMSPRLGAAKGSKSTSADEQRPQSDEEAERRPSTSSENFPVVGVPTTGARIPAGASGGARGDAGRTSTSADCPSASMRSATPQSIRIEADGQQVAIPAGVDTHNGGRSTTILAQNATIVLQTNNNHYSMSPPMKPPTGDQESVATPTRSDVSSGTVVGREAVAVESSLEVAHDFCREQVEEFGVAENV